MRFSLSLLFVLLTFANLSFLQFVPTPTDLTSATGFADVPLRYKEVPTGICELDPNVKSFAGYADVEEYQHLFWWFFEARDIDPATAPLTVWLGGGPGSSSIDFIFAGLGPCNIDPAGNTVVNNPFSWSNVTNIIFIDQPVAVGLSYSIPVPGFKNPDTTDVITLPDNNCPDFVELFGSSCATFPYQNQSLTANSTNAAAPNIWKALQGFMGVFPQYSRNEFHLATESFGGHYGPIFADFFEEQNALIQSGQSLRTSPIKLSSLSIGNGWFDPVLQYPAYYNYTFDPGNSYINPIPGLNSTIQSLMFNNLFGKGNCLDQIQDCNIRGIDEICGSADLFCEYNVEAIFDIFTGRDEQDIRELEPDPFPPEEAIQIYLNSPDVQAAVGAFQNYTVATEFILNTFEETGDDARRLSIIENIRSLLDKNITVTFYAGDADYSVNWIGVLAVADEINAPGFATAGFANLSTPDGIVHGQVKQAGKFSFVRIYDSGHEVAFYQPLAAVTMVERAIKGLDIETGTVSNDDSYMTVGSVSSDFVEGPESVQNQVTPSGSTYNITSNTLNPLTRRRSLMRGAAAGQGHKGARRGSGRIGNKAKALKYFRSMRKN